jgi:hypothetical protein
VGNPVSLDSGTIMQKPTYFSCVSTLSLFNGSLSRVYNTFLKIKRLEMDSKPPQTLAKPYKYLPSLKAEEVEKKKEKIRKRREISIRNTSVEVQEPKQKMS